MIVKRIVGITLFLVGLLLGFITNLFSSDPIVQAWYTNNRSYILPTAAFLIIMGIFLTFISLSDSEASKNKRFSADNSTLPPHYHHKDSQAYQQTNNDDTKQYLDDPQTQFLVSQLNSHQRNLKHLLGQKAVYASGESPIRILNQIEFEQETIAQIEEQLKTRKKV
jgi:hypothetical protein